MAINLEACICGDIDASIESFEISLPRHGALLFASTLATELGSGLGIFGVVALTHESDHSCALELYFDVDRSSGFS